MLIRQYCHAARAEHARSRGVTGLIIDAGRRDVQSLKEIAFPVWSKPMSAEASLFDDVTRPLIEEGH